MLDKVLKAWECCDPFNRRCFECPYDADCFHDSFDRVAIADMVKLLKECDTVEYALSVLRKHGWKETDDVPYPVELLKEQQPKKGHWKENDDKNFQCSECGYEGLSFDDVFVYEMKLDKFCPNCGADMRKDGEQE